MEKTVILNFDVNTTITSHFNKTYDLKPSIVPFPVDMSIAISLIGIVAVIFLIFAFKKKPLKRQSK